MMEETPMKNEQMKKETNDQGDKHAHFTHMSPRHSGEKSVKIIIFIIFYF